MSPVNPGILPDFLMGIFALTHASIIGPDQRSRGISWFFSILVKSVEVAGVGMAILYELPHQSCFFPILNNHFRDVQTQLLASPTVFQIPKQT